MKITPVLLIVLLLTLLATSLVQAQTTEKIALYADKFGTDCSISDTGAPVVFVYMIHEGTGLRLGSVFRAPQPPCWTGATWVGDAFPPGFVFVRSTQDGLGLEVGYGCAALPVYIGKMIFETAGAAEDCCKYPVLAHGYPPQLYPPGVVALDCETHRFPILGGSAVINENANCPCAPPLAAESTTWGRVKSLYH